MPKKKPKRVSLTPKPSPKPQPRPESELLTRQGAAELASKEFAPVSVRTVERWPLAWQRRNGRVYCRADDLRELLRERAKASAWVRGGRSGRRDP